MKRRGADLRAAQADRSKDRPTNARESAMGLNRLVAGDGFGGVLVSGSIAGRGLGRAEALLPYNNAVAVGVPIAVAIYRSTTVAGSGSDGHRFSGVGEVGRNGFGDVGDRADLDDGGLRLLEHQLLVNGADLGLFLEGLLAANAVFLSGGERNVVFEVTN